jgi:radical SAM protein with 4Fe4S-binding SPASM domain
MSKFTSLLDRLIPPGNSIALPPPGIYHFTRDEQGEKSRIHLRIDADRHAVLIVNASRIVHLNPTAGFMAYLILNQTSPEDAKNAIAHSYRVSKNRALFDYTQIAEQITELIRADGACPIHDLNLDVLHPFSMRPQVPYRMDLALTYRCNNDCAHCYNARPRSFPEMETQQWRKILDTTWNLGIPHVVFTGGEPTLRADLPELIAYAEHNGQITGVNSNGRRFADKSYVQELIDAGLDHVQVTLESHNPSIHNQMVGAQQAWKQTVDGLHNVLDSSLYVMTNTTMLRQNSPFLSQTLEFIADLGVPTVGLNALIYAGRGRDIGTGISEEDLSPMLELARTHTSSHQQRLIWYTPTQYCHFDPVEFELGVKGCTAALYNMCIEPNGDVIPCQSYYQPVGNLLHDPWENIWNHPICHSLRERQLIPEKCHSCALLSECGGGCPLHTMVYNSSGGYDA